MFLDNSSTKRYYKIIHNAKSRVLDENSYCERHHIIPKSLGGSDDEYNIVKLTAREHFIAHKLLVKMTEDKSQKKMIFALWRLSNHKIENTSSSKGYEYARKMFSESIKSINSRPKTAKEKLAMSGKRPHVNQTGENNNNFKGYYRTPWGIFSSISEASKKSPINMTMGSISTYCKNKSNSIIKKKNKYGLDVGKTPKELGYEFINREVI